MRDFRLGKDKRDDNYILNYEVKNNIVHVAFANKKGDRPTMFDKVEANDENINKLNKKMNDQLNYGIKNKIKYKIYRNISIAITTASIAVTSLSCLSHNRAIGVLGAIALGSAIISGVKAYSKNKDLEEIKKAELISDNIEKFKNVKDYPNALSTNLFASEKCFEEQVKKTDILITKVDGKDVPNANRIEEYSYEQVKKLTKDMTREKNMGFVTQEKNSYC